MGKKVLMYLVIVVSSFLFLCSCSSEPEDISNKLIRFHVIANSDSTEDQNLKLNVRDKVLKEIGPKLEKSKSKEESERIISNNIETIERIAEREISVGGKDYDVEVSLGKSVFPAKMYSSIVLPAGEYDALKITIGNGEGKNWWCVMFPPLCFIDITHGITSDETEDRMKTVLDNDEYEGIRSDSSTEKKVEAVKKLLETDSKNHDEKAEKEPEKVKLRFKSFEIIKDFFSRIRNILGK